MNQRAITWGLGLSAFAITLAVSSWHDGLWSHDSGNGNAVEAVQPATPAVQLPPHPFAADAKVSQTPMLPRLAAAAAPSDAAASAPAPRVAAPPEAPAEPPQESNPEPQADSNAPPPVPDVDEQEFRDRAAAREERQH